MTEVLTIDKLIYAVLALIVGIIAGYLIRRYISEGKINNAEELAKK
jgi:metal dependent phosphohydrolase